MEQLNPALQADGFPEAWHEWVSYRLDQERRGGKPFSPWTHKADLSACERWGAVKAVAVIRLSIRSGWQKLVVPQNEGELAEFLPGASATNPPKRGLTPEEQRQVHMSRMTKGKQ